MKHMEKAFLLAAALVLLICLLAAWASSGGAVSTEAEIVTTQAPVTTGETKVETTAAPVTGSGTCSATGGAASRRTRPGSTGCIS